MGVDLPGWYVQSKFQSKENCKLRTQEVLPVEPKYALNFLKCKEMPLTTIGDKNQVAYFNEKSQSASLDIVQLGSQDEASTSTILPVGLANSVPQDEQLKVDKGLGYCQHVQMTFCDGNLLQFFLDAVINATA